MTKRNQAWWLSRTLLCDKGPAWRYPIFRAPPHLRPDLPRRGTGKRRSRCAGSPLHKTGSASKQRPRTVTRRSHASGCQDGEGTSLKEPLRQRSTDRGQQKVIAHQTEALAIAGGINYAHSRCLCMVYMFLFRVILDFPCLDTPGDLEQIKVKRQIRIEVSV